MGTHVVSEERRGALHDPATLTPGFCGAVGAAQGGVGCTPEVLLARKGLDASGTLVSPPLTLMSLSSTSAGGVTVPHHDGAHRLITSLRAGAQGAGFASVCLVTPRGLRDLSSPTKH